MIRNISVISKNKYMTREEWRFVFSEASANMAQEICDGIVHNILPSQEKLIAQEIINQIFKAL